MSNKSINLLKTAPVSSKVPSRLCHTTLAGMLLDLNVDLYLDLTTSNVGVAVAPMYGVIDIRVVMFRV